MKPVDQSRKPVKNRIGHGNIYKICPVTLTIVDVILYNDEPVPADYFVGAGIGKLVPGDKDVIRMHNTLTEVHKTGKTIAGTYPIRLPLGIERRYIRFQKMNNRFVLAYT